MADPVRAADRLQPALLDRLTDEHPEQRQEAPGEAVMSRARLREAVLRDLGWLFNSVRPPPPQRLYAQIEAAPWKPDAKATARARVIDFSLLPLPEPAAAAGAAQASAESVAQRAERRPHAQRSVLNYGLPALSGLTASSAESRALVQQVRQAILDFEPRILPQSLEVERIEPDDPKRHYNLLDFRITGKLWAQPVPLELLLQTRVDLETGHVEVSEAGGAAVPRRA